MLQLSYSILMLRLTALGKSMGHKPFVRLKLQVSKEHGKFGTSLASILIVWTLRSALNYLSNTATYLNVAVHCAHAAS